MNLEAKLAGLALIAASMFTGCASTAPKDYSNSVGFYIMWNTKPNADINSNEPTGKYLPPLITIPIDPKK